VKITAISDTHSLHKKITEKLEGDILICAGDITRRGSKDDVLDFNHWLGELDFKYKIVIAGNHDFCFEKDDTCYELLANAIYLEDSFVETEGLKIYGSPWQPWFFNWAFNLQRGKEISDKWDLIPDDIDILVTHGPPFEILDKTKRGEFVGCKDLKKRVLEVRPKVHIFGHIHEAYGAVDTHNTKYINASVCNLGYKPVNKPVTFEI